MKKRTLNLRTMEQEAQKADEFVDDLEGRSSAADQPEWTKEFAASGGGKSTTTVTVPGDLFS